MKKGLIKAGVLAVVFILSLVFFERVANHNQVDLTTEMKEATLPIVVLYDEETQINELHGYTSQMDATSMRDTITPVSSNKEIPLLVRTYGYQIDTITYEIRSIDGERLISDGDVGPLQKEGDLIRTSIPVQSLLEKTREYVLTLKLRQEDTTCYYYTRIADEQDCYVRESVAFAEQINELSFSGSTDELSSYWEPNASGDNSSLHQVTINSSLTQLGWANLECSRLTTPVPAVKEMNSSYNIIMLNYVVTTNSKGKEAEYYNVEEYYRIRYTSERMYLLNFERTMSQIFSGENDILYENFLQLGIRSRDVEYMQNEAAVVTCFVQEGDLWSYNQSEHRLARVYSFRGHEGIDARENYMQHDIRILAVDESGSIDYVVCGYMNRGEHEGELGLSFLRYDSGTNTNEERMFLAFDKSYEILKAELDKLLYTSENDLYLMYNGTVHHVDMDTFEISAIAEDLKTDSFAVSESNRYIAWASGTEQRRLDEIVLMDLENGRTRKIAAKEGKSLRILGFLQEDFVYGIAADKHRVNSSNGIAQNPMYALRIVESPSARILKEYRKKGYYLDSVEFNDGILIINRLTAQESGYAAAQQDSIVNRSQEKEEEDVIHTTVTELKETQVQLTLAKPKPEKDLIYVAAKLVLSQNDRQIALKTDERQPGYIVYAKGKVALSTTNLSDAIACADEEMGVVVDERQNYVWKRARKNAQLPLELPMVDTNAESSTVARCLSAMLRTDGVEVNVEELLEKGDTPQEILHSLLPNRRIFSLMGGSLVHTFYYVNCGTPVYAVKDAEHAVLIVGYDASGVWYYDPLSGAVEKDSLEDAEQMFLAAGGVYIAFQ